MNSNTPSRRRFLAGSASLALAAPALVHAAPAATHTLTLAPLRHRFRTDGPESQMIGVNASSPGPALRVPQGQPLRLQLENRLSEPSAVQLHGYRGPNAIEAIPGLNASPLAPGESRMLEFTPKDSGTYLYMPVLQGKVAEQRARGLGGMFIVEEAEAQPVDLDHPVVLSDVLLGDDGVIEADFDRRINAARYGRLGNMPNVNGKQGVEEISVRPNARIRLRLANLANARIMPMKFRGGRQSVLAIDGQSCEPFDPLHRAVVLLPGSRYEVMIDAPETAGQAAEVLVDAGKLHLVVNFKTAGEPLPPRPPVKPLPLNTLPPSIRLQNAARVEFAISGGLERNETGKIPDEAALRQRWPQISSIFQINSGFNKTFPGKPLLSVKAGAPVVLALSNRTAWSQVITLHGHVFRLLHPMDDGWEPYFLDTIHLPPMTTSRIAFDAVNPGKWAINSTIAEHYDAGVLGWYEVN